MTSPYEGLRTRLVWPFVLLGYVVSALFALGTFATVSALEERAIERALLQEMESLRYRLRHNADALPPNASLMHGVRLPSPEIPDSLLQTLPEDRVDRITLGDHRYSVLVGDIDGTDYALLHDRQGLDEGIWRLALFLLLSAAALTLLSYVVGRRLAMTVVRPIGQLMDDLAARGAPAGTQGTAREDYPANEIGELARRIDAYAHRLQDYAAREACFASDASHELRTPIAVIRGAAEVLACAHDDLPVASRQRLDAIQRTATRMGELVEAMLLLSREPDAGHDPSTAMRGVVEEVVGDCRPLLVRRPVELRLAVTESPILPVDRPLAYVAISNIVRNACAYTEQGVIEVVLEARALRVRDTGPGIAAERFPTLFDRNSRGEGSEGFGLGLSILSRVAQRLGWRVSLTSTPGQGTEVTLWFGG